MLVLGLTPLLAVGLLTVSQNNASLELASDALQEEFRNKLKTLATAKSEEINNWFLERQ
ncbi:MAG: hypothetical protein HeimC3_37020 [Candidatus Heimdallarchaeota archaeon LC_3]|nr:MAG: hypothetical protein HeimC3_37020 [Candidatus Heimdallarchaeota archaeon LC_3]